MQQTVNYKGDNTGRRAINDLLRWFGLAQSKFIIGEMPRARDFARRHPEWNSNKFLNGACFAIEIGGVQGEPIRRLFAHYLGEARLQAWLNEPSMVMADIPEEM